MIIIGCDYHPGSQQIAYVDTETGAGQERRLGHREEAEKFYRDLATRGAEVRVGMEASGHGRGSNDCWGAEHRVVDWRRGEDPSEAGTQAEGRSRGCPAHSETHAEGRFSADLGSQLGQS